ncbi:MAG: hypothetical protein Q8L92_12210 [Rubrivivax sp.]|nr:hypothetical protein [Rubrivivax sp.]
MLAALAYCSAPPPDTLRTGPAHFVLIGGLRMTQALHLSVTALLAPLLAVFTGRRWRRAGCQPHLQAALGTLGLLPAEQLARPGDACRVALHGVPVRQQAHQAQRQGAVLELGQIGRRRYGRRSCKSGHDSSSEWVDGVVGSPAGSALGRSAS